MKQVANSNTKMSKAVYNQVVAAADKAIFGLQYNTGPAVRFICSEVPGATTEQAMAVFQAAIRANKGKKAKK